MATAERTYSFRAPEELGQRLATARKSFDQLAQADPETSAWLSRELEMGLARKLAAAPDVTRDQSAFLRTAAELLVSVTEKVAQGIELGERYAAARAEDVEATAFHEGALKTSKRVWR